MIVAAMVCAVAVTIVIIPTHAAQAASPPWYCSLVSPFAYFWDLTFDSNWCGSLASTAGVVSMKLFLSLMSIALWLSASLAYLGLWLASIAAALLLQVGGFTTNAFVVTGWPFLQGIANLGFIMALLYIAFSTATGLGDFGARRMLPRLLIAALLINFSLVIGGMIIDASRLVMAAMIRGLGNPGITEIGSRLLAQSPSFYHPLLDGPKRYAKKPAAVFQINNSIFLPLEQIAGSALKSGCAVPTPPKQPPNNCLLFPSDSYEIVLALMLGTALAWAIFIGLIVVTAGLFVRYIALVLLLMVSPLAYLAIAFPGLQSMQKEWWSNFIKFVLYGPISLFILILMSKVIDAGNQVATPALQGNFAAEFLVKIPITVGLFWGLCFIATKTAMQFGKMGAEGTLNFGKRIARTASGAGLAIGAGRDVGKYVTGSADKQLRQSKYTKWFMPPKRDEKGNLKPGQSSYAEKAAKGAFGWINPEEREKRRQKAALRAVLPAPPTLLAPTDVTAPSTALKPFMNAYALSQGHVAKTMGVPNINVVMEHGNGALVNGIVSNKDFLRDLSATQKNDLQAALERNTTTLSPAELSRAVGNLLRTFDELRKE